MSGPTDEEMWSREASTVRNAREDEKAIRFGELWAPDRPLIIHDEIVTITEDEASNIVKQLEDFWQRYPNLAKMFKRSW